MTKPKRRRPPKMPHKVYGKLWRIVDGAVRDTFAMHPEYLGERSEAVVRYSVNKRVVGTLWGFVSQETKGRSDP